MDRLVKSSKEAHPLSVEKEKDDAGLNLNSVPGAENILSHWPLLTALLILIVMLTQEFGFKFQPSFPLNLIIYVVAFLLAGYKVLGMAFRKASDNPYYLEVMRGLKRFFFEEGVTIHRWTAILQA